MKLRSIITSILCLFALAGQAILAGQALGAATILPPAETCFAATTGINGQVGALGTITAGTGGTAATYGGVALTGGSGTGATANVTVAAGGVTAVSILNPGTNYVVGDALSATAGTIGGTAGFSIPVNSVTINSSLAAGTVAFYIPSTSTFKQTWQDAAQTILNTNPVTLNQNGCALIYGTGGYRQVLSDNLGNVIWDQLTTDVSANNNTFWAGVAGGTPNAITVIDAGFNATDGSIINFTALATNTGPATLNPSSYGNVPVVKDTTAGPVALVGGEIIQTNPISTLYRASDNSFHLLNAAIQSASGATAPLCGAIGLKITNNSGTPNSIVALTGGQIVMQTPAGLTINRSNVSVNINLTTGTVTSAANGMDGETVGTSRWLDVWAIDNGAAAAGLVSVHSGNGLAPTMPSGYTYKCRLGAMAVDGSGNLLRSIQLGPIGQPQNVLSSNVTVGCHVTDGIQGSTYSDTSPVLVTISVAGDSFCAPATSTAVNLIITGVWKNGGPNSALAAPSTAWGGTNNGPLGSAGQIYPLWERILNISPAAWMTLESSTIGYAATGAGGALNLMNWRDNVNAN